MSRLLLPIPFLVLVVGVAAPLACARQTSATDGNVVKVDPTETPGVVDACIKSTERLAARCGVADSGPDAGIDHAKTTRDCKQLALTHGEGAIAWLACRGDAPCDAPAAGCEQTSTFGDELCASPVMSCSTYCTDRFRLFLDEIAPRLKPALLSAARACGAQKLCGDASACMTAWIGLIE
jgi:hypothetical protein